jgi:iron(III) transport system substrate-binding protein
MTSSDSFRLRNGSVPVAWLVAGAVWLASGPVMAQKTPLVVYTSFGDAQTRAYKEAFEKVHQDVDVRWTSGSSPALTARIVAERAAPKADMVVGVAASLLMPLDADNMLLPFAPANLMAIASRYRDPRHPPTYWWGVSLSGAAICFNAEEAKKQKLPKPATWRDLAKPVYKGKIAMPNPQTSAVGSFYVSGWLKMYGEAAGWKFLDGLNDNVTGYTIQPDTPCQRAAAGETPIGLSFDGAAQRLKASGAPIEVVVPAGDVPWDLWTVAILKSSTRVEPAQRFADWLSGKDAMEIAARSTPLLSLPSPVPAATPSVLPADYEKRLLKYDFLAAGKAHDAMQAEWKKRYGGKAEVR